MKKRILSAILALLIAMSILSTGTLFVRAEEADLADEGTQAEIADEGTQAEIVDEETQAEITEEETQAEITEEETQAEITDESVEAAPTEADVEAVIPERHNDEELAETGTISKRVGDFYYEIRYDNTASLTSYYGTATSVTLPSKIDGYTVREVGYDIFFSRRNVTKVVIPSTVTTIHSSAFRDCTKLAAISVPSSVYSIGKNAFDNTAWYNKQANGIVYAGNVAIGYKGTSPSNISFKSGTKGVAGSAFEYNKSITSVSFPSSIIDIGTDAFYGCSNLYSVSGIDNVKYVGSGAFLSTQWYSNKPQGLVYIGKALYCYKGSMSTIPSTINVQSGTISISPSALWGYDYLEKVVLPNTVTTIGRHSFGSCDNLTSVNIPSSVTYMDEFAFSNCLSLTQMTIPASVKYLSSGCFYKCTSLKNITLASGIVGIGFSAFEYCKKLSYVKLPATMKFIEGYAFMDTSIKSVDIPKSVIKLGSSSFGFYYNSSNKSTKISGFTVKGYFNTEAQAYAKSNAFKFVSLSGYKLETPIVKSLAKTSTGVKVTWGKISGAAKYRLFRKVGSGSWAKVADTTAVSIIDKSALSGVKYTYTVRCVSANGKSITSDYDKVGKSIYYLRTLAAPKAPTLKNTKNGVQVKWKKVSGAAKYRIFRKTGSGSWKKLADTNKLSFVDKTAKKNVTYSYTIRCISLDGKKFTSSFNKKGTSIKCKR